MEMDKNGLIILKYILIAYIKSKCILKWLF